MIINTQYIIEEIEYYNNIDIYQHAIQDVYTIGNISVEYIIRNIRNLINFLQYAMETFLDMFTTTILDDGDEEQVVVDENVDIDNKKLDKNIIEKVYGMKIHPDTDTDTNGYTQHTDDIEVVNITDYTTSTTSTNMNNMNEINQLNQ